jgi:hypothetical protein
MKTVAFTKDARGGRNFVIRLAHSCGLSCFAFLALFAKRDNRLLRKFFVVDSAPEPPEPTAPEPTCATGIGIPSDGAALGDADGTALGDADGDLVGTLVGDADGTLVGDSDGAVVTGWCGCRQCGHNVWAGDVPEAWLQLQERKTKPRDRGLRLCSECPQTTL